MLGIGAKRRVVHIHVGPHKTGSTAIQHDLRDHRAEIRQTHAATVIDDQSVWSYAKAVNAEDEAGAERALDRLVKHCSEQSGDLLLSCEDLAGHLPGRGDTRKIYPYLWSNMNRLRRVFRPDTVKFYFFVRDRDAWLRSAYVQLLKYRTKFKSFEGYCDYLRGLDAIWDGLLERPRDRLGENFVAIPYEEGGDFSASKAFLNAALGSSGSCILQDRTDRPNTSPADYVIDLLERANRSGASQHAIQQAKSFLLSGPGASEEDPEKDARPPWPPERVKPEWLASELLPLWSRVEWRAAQEAQANLMPESTADLSPYRYQLIDASDELPDLSREKMADQATILEHRLRGFPQTCYLLGLTISYLRRHTGHEDRASRLFQRLWGEEHPVLLGFLPTRWLISSFQTFMDHGVNDAQRAIGAAAFFFSNTIKMYEAERALEGLPTDSVYPNTVPVTKAGFWGLDRYGVGATDMLLNTNAHFLELAASEPRAGRVAQEFLLRLKRYNSAFSRMDKSRVEHDIDKPPFSDCWSFFEPQKKKPS